jgi:predicted nucleic acid-binding Zn ribbon protein
MPVYTYRREDGTTFDIRQTFSDEPLHIDPQTGQRVTRIVQAAGVIFKGSGFYVNDSKGARNPANTAKTEARPAGEGAAAQTSAPAPAAAAAD